MTPSPRSGKNPSGQDRNQPRGGRPRAGGSQGGSKSGGSYGGSKSGASYGGSASGPSYGGSASGAPYGGPNASGSQNSGAKTGAGRKPAGKAGGSKQPGKRAPRAFGNERFGSNLGPVKRPGHGAGGPSAGTARTARAGRSDVDLHNPEGVRLQKIMASAGVASRRVCEDMIEAGRVEVDGQIVTELGLRVDPKQVAITVDGIRLQLDESLVYMVFNKPKGVVSTMEDPEGRPCISDFLKKRQTHERLFHIGRLDVSTEGLLLLTNDGELANRLSHPKYEVPKTYLVQVHGPMGQGVGAQMREGIELEDGVARVDSFRLVDSTPGHILVEVVLHSGKNRIVRRLFDAAGYPVERLVRVQVGPIRLNDQRQGSIRVLGRQEIGHLLASVGM
jgi:pseudouridine synthase